MDHIEIPSDDERGTQRGEIRVKRHQLHENIRKSKVLATPPASATNSPSPKCATSMPHLPPDINKENEAQELDLDPLLNKFFHPRGDASLPHPLPSTLIPTIPHLPPPPNLCTTSLPGSSDCPSGSGLNPLAKDFVGDLISCAICRGEWHTSCAEILFGLEPGGTKPAWYCNDCFTVAGACRWDKHMCVFKALHSSRYWG